MTSQIYDPDGPFDPDLSLCSKGGYFPDTRNEFMRKLEQFDPDMLPYDAMEEQEADRVVIGSLPQRFQADDDDFTIVAYCTGMNTADLGTAVQEAYVAAQQNKLEVA
jgi:hypothetical protein